MPDPDDAAHWREHSACAAANRTRWADPLAEQQDRINALLPDAAAIGSGARVLDLASGLLDMNAGTVWEPLDGATRSAVDTAIAQRLAPMLDGDVYRLSTCVRIAAGTRH